MDRRAGLLKTEIHYPTLAELFGTIDAWATNNRNMSSTATLTAGLPSSAVEGDNWYYFYLCGGSLEISKVHVDSSSSITRTRLSSTYVQTQQLTNVSGTDLVTANSIYAGNIVKIRFSNKYSPSIIDYCLSMCYKRYNKYYYSSTATNDSSKTQVAASTVTAQPGIIFSAYRCYTSNSGTTVNNIWGISPAATPTNPIICCVSDNEYTNIGVWWKSGDYYIPRGTENGNNSAYKIRSYAMVNMYEDW